MLMRRSPSGERNPLVAKLTTFAALDWDDTTLLRQACADARYVPTGTDLSRQGAASDGVLVVLEGFACRYKLRRTGARQIMAYLVPGDLGDLDGPLLARMDHAVATLSPATVVRLTPETVTRLLDRPRLATVLRFCSLIDAATSREWLVNLGRRSAPERLAHLFCELLVRMHTVGLADGNAFVLPMTQTDLADTTGITNVHVNRSLRELRQGGLIELHRRRLTIRNLSGLQRLAEFDPAYLHLNEAAGPPTTPRPDAVPSASWQTQHLA